MKITKKYGIELRYWIVGIILFSGIFALMVLGFHDAASGYGAANLTNPGIEERYDRLSEHSSLISNLQETAGGGEGLKLNIAGTIFTATIGVLNAVLESVTFIPSVFANFAEDFGIPSEVTNLFFVIVGLIITVLIIFAILNAIRR